MEWLGESLRWFLDAMAGMGYPGIYVLMLLASSFLPVPSQAALIPAGWLASQGRMSLPLVIGASAAGTLSGALFNYGLALWLGRPFFERHGRWFFLTPEKLARVDRFFEKHGEVSTFLGRMVTGVRHYISLPAGLARMRLSRFVVFTLLGGGLYDSLEVGIGYVAGGNQELIAQYSREMFAGVVAFCALVVAGYAWRYRRRARA